MTKRTSPAFRFFALVGLMTLILVLTSCKSRKAEASLVPDTVLINGRIITVDEQDTIAGGVAIKDGKIIAVDSSPNISKLAGEDTRIIDLQGLTATPGLIDSHCHFTGYFLLYLLDLSYPAVTSIEDVKAKVKEMVKELEPGEWILGRGWDEGKLSELRYIHASDLDLVAPDNPVWLTHTMGHYGAANSYALKLANVTKDTPAPPGGSIDRYPDGTLTGILKETAQSLVARHIPEISAEERRNGVVKIIEEFNKEGMTAVKDPGISPAKWEIYQDLLTQGQLTVRIFALWRAGKTIESAQNLIDRVGPFTKPYISTGDDRLISGGIKLFIDGSGGARTAWLHNDWNKDYTDIDEGNTGYPVINPDIFRQQIKMFHDAGLHVSVHAIGDRAIDYTVDSYVSVLKDTPTHGLRHGIIHCNIPTDHAIETMAELQKTYDTGYPEAQATFTWWIGDTYSGNFGPERSLRLMPFKTYLDKNVKFGGGSDFPVTPLEARFGLWASLARQTLLGVYGQNPFGTEESIDILSALRSYTIWNAHLLFLEDKIGSIEVGKYADIAVWDKDMTTIPMDEIKDLKCQMTLIEGDIVYTVPETPIQIEEPSGSSLKK